MLRLQNWVETRQIQHWTEFKPVMMTDDNSHRQSLPMHLETKRKAKYTRNWPFSFFATIIFKMINQDLVEC